MKAATIIKNILPYGISSYFSARNREKLEIPSSDEPLVYNAHGEKMKTLFLSSDISRHWPYGFVTGRFPQYTFWDRSNYGLNNHVYCEARILDKPLGKPVKKFALFLESESVELKNYKIFDKNPGLEKEFHLIFTHSEKHLNKYSNAVFSLGAGVYYGTELHGGIMHDKQYENKTKNVSIVSSEKTQCELHKFRLDIARYYKNNHNHIVDAFGTFDGGEYIKIHKSLDDYRYSIAMENEITPYRFTEKILNCFASMTVPIYIGATKIGDFFNVDGIITVPSLSHEGMDRIIAGCSKKDYEERLPAIIDNFNRVQRFLCTEDYMWTHYKQFFA
jgi:hypothetical protein